LYSSKISLLEVISLASPFLIKLFVQIFHHLKISQGVANKSFHISRPNLVVIKLPDFSLASTTKIHSEIHATISFLTGKL
jgi:hypothetical protein